MGLDDYSSEKISKASEFELEELLNKFKKQEVSLAKLGGFLAYNFLALSGLLGFSSWYIRSYMSNRRGIKNLPKEKLTLFHVVKKGSIIGSMIGGAYIAGFLIVGYYMMPISVFKKYCELQ